MSRMGQGRAWRVVILGLVLVFGLATHGCSDDGGTSNGAAEFNILTVLPLSGSFADKGKPHQYAIQMAVAHVEEAGGVMIKDASGNLVKAKINLIEVDEQGDANLAKQGVEAKLAELKAAGRKVSAIISSGTNALEGSLPPALENKIPHMEVSSGEHDEEFIPNQTTDYIKYALVTRATCKYLAENGADFVFSEYKRTGKWGRIVLMHTGFSHDKLHMNVFPERLQQLIDQELEANPSFVPPVIVNTADQGLMEYGKQGDDQPYTSYIADAMSNWQPDLIWWHIRGDQQNFNFMANARDAGYTGDLLTCGMSRKATILDPNELGGLIKYLDGRFWFSMRGPIRDQTKNPNLSPFSADYKAFTKVLGDERDADTFAPFAYDSALLALLGGIAVQSADPAQVRDGIVSVSKNATGSDTKVAYGNVGQAVSLLMQGQSIDYDGASGPMDIRDNRSVPAEYYIESVTYDSSADIGKYTVLDEPPPSVK